MAVEVAKVELKSVQDASGLEERLLARPRATAASTTSPVSSPTTPFAAC